jgi:hypothetical protein
VRPSANGIIWKCLLEKKVRVGLRFGASLALPSPLFWFVLERAAKAVQFCLYVRGSRQDRRRALYNPSEIWTVAQSHNLQREDKKNEQVGPENLRKAFLG